MIVVFDTSTLIFLFKPDALGPHFPESSDRVDSCDLRITHLLSQLQKSKSRIVIPTPALAELLTYAGDAGPAWLGVLSTSKHFRIAPFDVLAAIECADLARRRLGAGKQTKAERRKAKFDEQIVAIAAVENASVIYSDDADIRKLAAGKMDVMGMANMHLPPQDAQGSLMFDPLANDPQASEDEA